jgi:hypothetical protein
MNRKVITVSAAALLLLPVSNAISQGPPQNFSFNVQNVSGFPTGSVSLTGGGTYDLASGIIHTGGSFSVLSDINQGPLAGAKAGEGVRWDADKLLASTTFKCTGNGVVRPATTDANTVVILADFYRAGDGVNESFKAQMIVSANDLDPDAPGVQNVWVQGVGCGAGLSNFR